jgi:outer membrane protein OmpA-like peptidoglycan-associated protein
VRLLRRSSFAGLAITALAVAGCSDHLAEGDARGAGEAVTDVGDAGSEDAGGDSERARPRRDGLDLAAAGERTLELPGRVSPDRFDFPGIEVTVLEVEAEPERCQLGVTVTNEAIRFARDSAEITDEGRRALAEVADLLAGAEVVTIVGHTSTEGDAAWNQTLSERRAAAVEELLGDLLGPETTLSSTGRGELDPLEDPDDAERQRERNRRVEITADVEETRCG